MSKKISNPLPPTAIKPPPPPAREIRYGLFGMFETKESKRRGEEWRARVVSVGESGLNAPSVKPENDSISALAASIDRLTQEQARTNQLLTQIVAHNTDLLDSMSDEQEEPERMTLDGSRY